MKVLLLSYRMPFRRRDGGAKAVYHSALQILQSGAEVKMLAINPSRDHVEDIHYDRKFAKAVRFEKVDVNTNRTIIGALLALLNFRCYIISRFYSRRFEKRLIEILRTEKFDVIQLEHLCMCTYVDAIRHSSTAKIILKAQNVESDLWGQLAASAKNVLVKLYLRWNVFLLKKYETKSLRKVDGVVALTSDDKMRFSLMCYRVHICAIPISGDAQPWSLNQRNEKNADISFYHLGSMDWLPNQEGIRWFLDGVWKDVVKRNDRLTFHFAGKNMPDEFFSRSGDGVFCEGEVEDAFAYHISHRILVVPVLSSSGLRIKIVEAMLAGRMVISTAAGAKGIPYTDRKNIWIADNEADMIQAILYLADHPSIVDTIALEGMHFAKTMYGVERCAKDWKVFVEKLFEGEMKLNPVEFPIADSAA